MRISDWSSDVCSSDLRVDNRRYNGAALLGLRGIVVKSHGSADAYAFGFALQRAREAVHNGLLDGTTSAIDHLRQSLQDAAAQSAKLSNDLSDPASSSGIWKDRKSVG